MNTTKVAYSYIRFSTPEQAKGDSYRRQIAAGKKWCNGNGYVLSDETFFDKGKSGYKGKNLEAKGDLRRFLTLVENGDVKPGSVLLVENYDRLSRLEPVESYTMFLNLINAGLGIVFTLSFDKRIIDRDLIKKEPHLLQMVLGECIRAHAESERKSKLVKEAKQEKLTKIRNGEVVKHNGVPKYFTWNEETERYDHNEKADIVKRLVEQYMAGHSLYDISTTLNRDKVKSIKTSGNWSPRSVKCILQSRVLIGEYLGNPKFFQPLIDVETFNNLQVLLSQNSTNRGKQADLVNIFKGIVFCKCGKRMNVLTQSTDYRTKKKWKRVYRYIRCCSVNQGNPCEHKYSQPLDTIEREFFMECVMRDPRSLMNNGDNEETKQLKQIITDHQNRINSITEQITKLVSLSDTLGLAELTNKLTELKKEREIEKANLDQANLALVKRQTIPAQFEDIRKIVQDADEAKTDQEMWAADGAYDQAVKTVDRVLADNTVRMKLRNILPRIIGKIVVDSKTRNFEVFNHSGKSVYQSIDVH